MTALKAFGLTIAAVLYILILLPKAARAIYRSARHV